MSLRKIFNRVKSIQLNQDDKGASIRLNFDSQLDVSSSEAWHDFFKHVVGLAGGWLSYSYTCDQGRGGNIVKYNYPAVELGYKPNVGYKAQAPSLLNFLTFYTEEVRPSVLHARLKDWLDCLHANGLLDGDKANQLKAQIETNQASQLLRCQRQRDSFLSSSIEPEVVTTVAAPNLRG